MELFTITSNVNISFIIKATKLDKTSYERQKIMKCFFLVLKVTKVELGVVCQETFVMFCVVSEIDLLYS